MPRDSHPLQIFTTHKRLANRGEGPSDIRVFANERFLFASYSEGREQVLDVRAHERLELLVIYLDWIQEMEATHRSRRVPNHPPEAPKRPSQRDVEVRRAPAPKRPLV